MKVIRLFLVDDVPAVREMLRVGLSARGDRFAVVGEAGNGRDALRGIRDLAPDVVLLDVEMPVMNGLELLDAMEREGIRASVVLCSGKADLPEHLPGVVGRLNKPIRLDRLAETVELAVGRSMMM